jgi:hypothetical protein
MNLVPYREPWCENCGVSTTTPDELPQVDNKSLVGDLLRLLAAEQRSIRVIPPVRGRTSDWVVEVASLDGSVAIGLGRKCSFARALAAADEMFEENLVAAYKAESE